MAEGRRLVVFNMRGSCLTVGALFNSLSGGIVGTLEGRTLKVIRVCWYVVAALMILYGLAL